MNTNTIHTGDAFDVLPELPDASVHAVITDPPYGLNFMPNVTNGWDDFEPKEYQEWCEEWAREVKRVLKPGGHLLAFSGNRTHHRLFTGVEDAGFEIRDTLTWHYGSGFPKAADVSKTIDKRADAEREVVGVDDDFLSRNPNNNHDKEYHGSYNDGAEAAKITAPATDAAKKWDGWKTGLKPATEFVVMARKPRGKLRAIVDSVLKHGTGALNIDACRVEHDVPEKHTDRSGDHRGENDTLRLDKSKQSLETPAPEGRYPANVVFDETAADALDARNDHTTGTVRRGEDGGFGDGNVYGDDDHDGLDPERGFDDSGGPSRYFYTSKASRSERTENGAIENDHPTVKPGDLMEWLIRLVTREGQVVLDPFTGSGTTCKAAKALHREFVGVERQPKYADIARIRCGLTPDDPSVAREEGQGGLDDW